MTVQWKTLEGGRAKAPVPRNRSKILSQLRQQYILQLMVLPFIVLVFFMSYLPMFGITMAFKDFKPSLGIFASPWVGLKYFEQFFLSGDFLRIMRNTLAMSILSLAISFPLTIAFAVLINEIRIARVKKFVQTASYLPHFISWVVAANMILSFLSHDGTLNSVLVALHLVKDPIAFMQDGKTFWLVIALSNLWKELGWGSIIYLAAISGIDTQIYDAAYIDGAGRIARIWHVTLPCISFTIVFTLILSVSSLLNSGFEQQLLMGNQLVLDYYDNIDTYTYRYGISQAMYSYGTAVGIFKSVVSFLLLYGANTLSKRVSDYRIW